MKTIRFGIIGTGGIAHRFAEACKNTPGVNLAAVASRAAQTAEKFGDEFDIPNRFSSYEAMAQSDCIDIAYVATPHGEHAKNAILFMNNKKAVISEKPIALNLKQLDEMIACAKENNVFLMEAMWARMVPGTLKALELIESGAIGAVRAVEASFCYEMYDEPDHHIFDLAQGGGSLLDVGCYGLSFASWYIGKDVEKIDAAAHLGKTGTDEHCAVTIKYKNGEIAQLSSATMLPKPNEGYIFGERGWIYCKRFYAPQKLLVHPLGADEYEIDCPYIGNGFEEQILEAAQCLRDGKKESSFVPHAQSRFIVAQMDEIRKKIGVIYPVD